MIIGDAIGAFDPHASALVARDALSADGQAFALIGGLALSAWGISRSATAVELAVHVGAAARVAAHLSASTARVHTLRVGGVAIRDPKRQLRIDLVDYHAHLGQLFRIAIDEAAHSGRVARLRDLELPLTGLEPLLAITMASGEPDDDADVRRVLRCDRLDFSRARALVDEHLGFAVASRLDVMAREAGRLVPEHSTLQGEPSENE